MNVIFKFETSNYINSLSQYINLASALLLTFIGGLQLANEQKEDSYHFLVFTDLFGNRTHGVVVQYYRAVQV